MATRPSWEGFIRFNLISIPVKAFNAVTSETSKNTGFHLLHKGCNARIQYKKVCPIHGEVSNDEIVSGYEVAKGKYAVVDKEERKELKSQDDKMIAIAAFVPPTAVEPTFYNGHNYYLVPDGKVAEKPYAVVLDAMREKERYAVAQIVLSGKPQLAVVYPSGKLLAMSLLHFESDIKNPSSFEQDVANPEVTAQEHDMAETLITAATTKRFDLSQFKDEYANKLAELLESKTSVAGKTEEKAPKAPAIINLMDALRESVNMAKKDKGGKNDTTRGHKTTRRATGRKTG